MLEKGPKIFAPSARFVGVVVRPGQMGLRPEVIRYPKKGQFSYLGAVLGHAAMTHVQVPGGLTREFQPFRH